MHKNTQYNYISLVRVFQDKIYEIMVAFCFQWWYIMHMFLHKYTLNAHFYA